MIEENIDKILELTKGYKHLVDSEQGDHIIMAFQLNDEIKLLKTNRLGEVLEVSTRSAHDLNKTKESASLSFSYSGLNDLLTDQ